jgi:hypothetical protein
MMNAFDVGLTFQVTKGSGPVQHQQHIGYDTPVTSAVAVLRGFDAGFLPGEDHHLGNLQAQVEAERDADEPRRVDVMVTLGLRDWSGNWDDDYYGRVEYTLITFHDPEPGPVEPLPTDDRSNS